VAVELAPDSPAREKLQAGAARRALQQALAVRLGQPVTLEVAALAAGEAGAAGPARLTAESARQQRLKQLAQQEPLLAKAVQEWDLELID
jgi:hypothetical protein